MTTTTTPLSGSSLTADITPGDQKHVLQFVANVLANGHELRLGDFFEAKRYAEEMRPKLRIEDYYVPEDPADAANMNTECCQ
jgi:uncharacterized membrane-anchored protein